MLLAPFGGTDESFFFGVPTADDNGSLRLPAGLHKFTQTMCRFQHCRSPAVWIDGSIDPRVTMASCDYPFIRRRCPGNFTDHIPDGAELVILLEMHPYFRWARTYVISKR